MGWFEQFQSRDATYEDAAVTRRTLTYYVDETTDESIAESTAAASLPVIYGPLILKSWQIKRLGLALFEVTAEYVDPDDPENERKPELNEIEWSFDTTGATTHISQSLSTAGSFARPGLVAPDFKGAINWDGQTVQGTDVPVPSLRLTATARLANGSVTDPYVKELARMTGRKNNAAWKSYAAGEVLFLGATGRQRDSADPTLSFHFEVSENVANLTVGDIVGINKDGQDLLWVYYRPEEDGAAKALVQQPYAAYVEVIVEEGSFANIGLGT